ncbi:Cytochrome C oxidase subunit IV [Lutimaribacter pacificus]|uniref:Cytochrome C oxidase subunit IV n=1 Tax=Lutimaribacter pacificus TaxID=391948 RepID=A0A1H0J1G6_9RHOB|nr:cytochrome C oxidase subunit IV family protein [Lutimaribacter pacificus]SDO37211.1 Cytochrome C oxidase subunit IV [Lutimaribacter pacificus]SHK15453.1 Cytochrome C oxidase subunit IV [Lutimaribacter pacificus]
MSITRAWAVLMALSLASTAIAWSGAGGVWAALAILTLAWGKAQVILNRYLRLSQAPDISRGVALVLGLFMAGVMGLAVAGG